MSIFTDRKLGGIPASLWLRNHALVKQMVQELGLKPAAEGPAATHLAALAAAVGERIELPAVIKRPHIPGGMRVPHLHLDGNVYLLDDKQWKDFSARLLKDLQARLSKVNAVSFDQAVDLSETIETLV